MIIFKMYEALDPGVPNAGWKNPFREWLDGLDASVRGRIQARIFRFEMGNLGDHKNRWRWSLGVAAGFWFGLPDSFRQGWADHHLVTRSRRQIIADKGHCSSASVLEGIS